MEALLDAADALVAQNSENPPRPDLNLPTDYNIDSYQQFMELKQGTTEKGRGWFASTDIPAGTVLLVAKPLAMVMNWQEEFGDNQDDHEVDNDDDMVDDNNNSEEEEQDSKLNELLLIQLLRDVLEDPNLWTDKLSQLYPRDNDMASKLPAWVCQDDVLFLQVEALLQDLKKDIDEAMWKDIRLRLPLIIRYNALSVETCPELLIHPGVGGHSALNGTALYYLPSFFNHSPHPNTSRYAVGDVMWFVANSDVSKGQELCISYLEHDVLCEGPSRRTHMLQMDFVDKEEAEKHDEHDDGPEFPVVDDLVQNELMGMDPVERLEAIQELFQQAMGKTAVPVDEQATMEESMNSLDIAGVKGGDDKEMMQESAESLLDKVDAEQERQDHHDKETMQESQNALDAAEQDHEDEQQSGVPWFQCDLQNLRILRAITLDGLGRTDEALKEWEECVTFAETKLPPNDESAIVMRVQAALCARCADIKMVRAKEHAAMALKMHNVLFGGGVARFRRRYQREVQLSLRPDRGNIEAGGIKALDDLWPVT